MNIQVEVQKIHAQYGTSEMANYQIQLLFEKVIAEHEASQWKPYPENKPRGYGYYLVQTSVGVLNVSFQKVDEWMEEGYWRNHADMHIIAFRSLPEPYRKEGKE